MAKQPTCLVCQKVMERGFITDLAHSNAVLLPRWCRGDPQSNVWSTIQGGEATDSQHRSGFTVIAYRCPECEALRLYAPSKDH